MSQADLLMATFRQLASAKAGAKGGLNSALHSKDGKEKADHFREQMRQVSKNQSPVIPKIDKNDAKVPSTATVMPVLEAGTILAELSGEAKPKPVEKEQPDTDDDAPKSSSDGKQPASMALDWHDSNSALSAVMTKLDQAPQNTGRDVRSISPAPALHVDPTINQKSSDLTDIVQVSDIDKPDIEASTAKRFAATVETTDTKTAVISKPVVREQETHFEPVQQVSTLQKIVDRMASDLPAVASPEGAHAAEAPPHGITKSAESRPVRMMTLELDPPNLGSVTIKMRLAGDSVEVHLTADRLETTHLLRQERSALSDAMQSAGYSFDIAAIDHTRTPDASMSNGQSQSQHQQASSDQRSSMQASNGSQTDGGSSGRSSGDGQSEARQDRQHHDKSHTAPERQQDQSGRHIRSSTVYL